MDPKLERHSNRFMRSRTVRRHARAIAFAIGATLALTASTARPDEDCREFTGPFTSVLVTGPTCASPLGLCTHGILTGQLPSTYDFTFLTLAPVINDPSTQLYTGASHIRLAHGAELFGRDHGALHFIGPTVATFVTVVDLVSGTRRYRGASGTIVTSGTLDFITGNAVGGYVAKICKGHERDDGDDERDDDGDDDGGDRKGD